MDFWTVYYIINNGDSSDEVGSSPSKKAVRLFIKGWAVYVLRMLSLTHKNSTNPV